MGRPYYLQGINTRDNSVFYTFCQLTETEHHVILAFVGTLYTRIYQHRLSHELSVGFTMGLSVIHHTTLGGVSGGMGYPCISHKFDINTTKDRGAKLGTP